MSFRAGNQGPKMWPECWRYGIAAITYEPLEKTDLATQEPGEPVELWAQLESSQKASLRRVAYEMKVGDTIYVKEGPWIIGKGVVSGPYFFDAKFRIVDPNGVPWAHQVPVDWSTDFPEVRILLGAEQLTVKELSASDVTRIETAAAEVTARQEAMAAEEGQAYVSEAAFRSRNRNLINAKKAGSGCRCEVCDMTFREVYGTVGEGFIIAHHVNPVSQGPRKTTLDDIALVCANCHAMLHRTSPPAPIAQLRALLVRGPG